MTASASVRTHGSNIVMSNYFLFSSHTEQATVTLKSSLCVYVHIYTVCACADPALISLHLAKIKW